MIPEDRIKALHTKVNYKIAQRDLYQAQKSTYENMLKEKQQLLELKHQTKQLLELFVKGTEYRIREYIEPIVNEGLQYVFEQDLHFHMYFSSRRNQVEIDFVVLRNSKIEEIYQSFIQDPVKNATKLSTLVKECSDINDSFGGAVNQVLAVLLKIVIVELLKLKGILVFDEPTSMVSEVYAGRLGKLLSSLSKKYSRQHVFITHSHTLAACADKIYHVDLVDGVSYVSEKETI